MALVSRAQDPGAQQDAEAAREKLLKAADQIEMIQSTSEATRTTLDAMRADINRLQQDNEALKRQLADLQAAFQEAETAHAKERNALVDKVAEMIAAAGKNSTPAKTPVKKKKEAATTESSSPATTPVKNPPAETAAVGTADAPPADTSPPANPSGDTTTTETAPPKTQKGYYHVVESGETLTLICSAYRQQGVNVTIAEIRKANGLTEKSVLKVGQKLFIPKPGT